MEPFAAERTFLFVLEGFVMEVGGVGEVLAEDAGWSSVGAPAGLINPVHF